MSVILRGASFFIGPAVWGGAIEFLGEYGYKLSPILGFPAFMGLIMFGLLFMAGAFVRLEEDPHP